MANGGDFPLDDNKCEICHSKKDIGGECPNQCQDYLDKSKEPPASSKLNDNARELENEDYTKTEKASTEHCAVSVEESRTKYSCVDFSSGKISSKLVTASSGLKVSSPLLANRGSPPVVDTVQPQIAQPQTASDLINNKQGPSASTIQCGPSSSRSNKGPRWFPATNQEQDSNGPSPRKKKRGIPGGVVVIYLTMQLCVKDSSLSDLPLTEQDMQAFQLLFKINKFGSCTIRNNKFFFYNTYNRSHHQIREIIDILKNQIKDICYRMFAGEIINGKTIETENDVVCFFELTGYHITQSQITGPIPSVLWSIEF